MSIAGVILDILVLILLAVTIGYAMRLSALFRTFRHGREDMQRLFAELAENIARAEQTIQGMHGASNTAGRELQTIIDESRFLTDELRFMNETGDNLAGRLESLAERNRKIAERLENAGGAGNASSYIGNTTPTFTPEPEAFQPEPPPKPYAPPPAEPKAEKNFSSQAERELYTALRRSKGTS